MNSISWAAMKVHHVVLLLTAVLMPTIEGRTQTLSDEATISVITCGPDQAEVYLAFGHSAFRVKDPALSMDYAFNYGVFDFDQPNFLLNFARGNNLYMLGVHDYGLFEQAYIADNRFVHEQLLNLTTQEKQQIFEYLRWNAEPDNRSYRYDYFYDNCATRIRDVVVETLGDRVSFPGDYITTDYTIRQLTDIYLKEQPWGDLGIDICLGLPMDKRMTPWEYMFIPDYIESGFAHATINHNGSTEPLVKETTVVYAAKPGEPAAVLPHPILIAGLFFLVAVGLAARDYSRKKPTQWFDRILFGATGIIGVLLVFLWLFTDHKAAAYNFNLLWAVPTNFIMVFMMKRRATWIAYYYLFVAIVSLLLLLTWAMLPQQLNYSLIPLAGALLVRAGVQYYLRKPAK